MNEIEVSRRYVQLPDSHKKISDELGKMLNRRLEKLHEAEILERNPKYAYKGIMRTLMVILSKLDYRRFNF
ncbi:hypothetical protein AKJ37_01135 [candidate division MSBL1 archaeon SCGC-AAA259I09]|uniref:Uncharacterized protein n=1 Tax=candidate division MSBL1 archaeon SCGC-AAA259I09 TaxID=1698267 RepID=A0A133UVC6_9EURY|nr:hypothetical protein AKJ37_01135 [candidate division MSBL1 archaeon SCGC-AAA259I09]